MPRGLAAIRSNTPGKFESQISGRQREESATVRDAGSLHVDKRLRGAQIGARKSIVPGKLVFVPHRPKKAEEKGSCGEHVSHAAQEHLSGRWRLAGETCHLQISQHHAGRCPAEDREESEVLQTDDGERRDVDDRS